MDSWIPSSVIYQINLRSLAARDPRNPIEAAGERTLKLSPIRYLAENLPVLGKLGINVLHLMPPFLMGRENRKGIGSPYCIRDFRKVDPEYGTIEELRTLVRRAHALGFKVILGMVPNHTSRDNVWSCTHPEYYVRTRSGKMAYDIDWTDTAKLNYREPGLRKAMFRTYDFWLSFLGKDKQGEPDGVDGFRLDMAHFINDRSFWDEALPVLKERHASRQLLFLAECYGMDNNLDLFRRGMTAAYDDEFYKILENFYGIDESGRSILLPDPNLARNKLFRPKYRAYLAGGVAGAMEHGLLKYEAVLGNGSDVPRLARYTDNHDESRGVYRFGPEVVRAMNHLVYFSGHTLPFLLAGQEFGALNRPAIHDHVRACEKGRRMLRKGRIEQHDGVEFEGNIFSRGREERAQWYSFYRELILLRLRTPALVHGDYARLDCGERCPPPRRTVVAFERRWKSTVLRGAVNLGPAARELRHAAEFRGKVLYGELEGRVLPPFSSILVRR